MQNKETRSLTLRCPPSIDESLFSYVARLSVRNGNSHVFDQAEQLGLEKPQIWFDDETIQRICELTLAPDHPETPKSASIIRSIAPSTPRWTEPGSLTRLHGADIPAELLYRDGHRRVCPECLKKDDPIHRVAWDFKVMQACPKHGVLLATRCAHKDCQHKPLDWRTSSLLKCTNGHDLTEIECPKATEEDLVSVRFFEDLVFGRRQLPDILDDLRMDMAIIFLRTAPTFCNTFRKALFPDAPDPGLLKLYGEFRNEDARDVKSGNIPPGTERRLSLGILIWSQPEDRLVSALRAGIADMASPTRPALNTLKMVLDMQFIEDCKFKRMMAKVLSR